MQSSSQDVHNAIKNNNWLWHRKWKTKVTLSMSKRERDVYPSSSWKTISLSRTRKMRMLGRSHDEIGNWNFSFQVGFRVFFFTVVFLELGPSEIATKGSDNPATTTTDNDNNQPNKHYGQSEPKFHTTNQLTWCISHLSTPCSGMATPPVE